jgi:Flp pilus assembly pilin Flp
LTTAIAHLVFISRFQQQSTDESGQMTKILQFLRDENATTAVEYAVMLALILITIFGTVLAFGGDSAAWWGNIDTEIDSYF